MNYGGGGIAFESKAPTGAAPAVTGMRNGLSLVAGFGELGANPLLHNTSFDLAGFDFSIVNGLDTQFILQPSGIAEINAYPGNASALQLDGVGKHVFLGDFNGGGPGMCLVINNNAAGGSFNVSNFLNSNLLDIDVDTVIAQMRPAATSPCVLRLDGSSFISQFGDVFNNFGSLKLNIDNSLERIFFKGLTDIYFQIDPVGGIQVVSGDVSNNNNGIALNVDDSNQRLQLKQSAAILLDVDVNGIQTIDPAGGGGFGKWQLGQNIPAVVVADLTQYLEVNVDGVLYKIGLVT